MQETPGLYLAALVLWFVPLLTLHHEWRFLTRTPDLPRSQWILSIAILVLFITMDLLLLLHTRLDPLSLTTLLVGCLLLSIVCSMLLMTGRLRVFTRMQADSRAERRAMIAGVSELIDERKREKIRQKYGEEDTLKATK